jgi:hypothetical protein
MGLPRITLINYFELSVKSKHFNTFQDNLNTLNPVVQGSLLKQSEFLLSKGIMTERAAQSQTSF